MKSSLGTTCMALPLLDMGDPRGINFVEFKYGEVALFIELG